MQDSKQNQQISQISIGIDAGNFKLKAAFLNNKKIQVIESDNFLELREECEIFFDDFVTSCVIALPENYSKRYNDEIAFKAKTSGFENVNLITSIDAVILSVNSEGCVLVLDVGKTHSEALVINHNKLQEKINFEINGDFFNRIFSEWLSARLLIEIIDENFLIESENLKISLSKSDFTEFRGVKIKRDDFERLIRFHVRKIMHTLKRLESQYNPEKIIFTGNSCKIPLILNTASIMLKKSPEYIENLIAKGTAIKNNSLFKNESVKNDANSEIRNKIRNLRHDLISIEEILTRSQKDRLYNLFTNAESGNYEIINILENLMLELKTLRSE